MGDRVDQWQARLSRLDRADQAERERGADELARVVLAADATPWVVLDSDDVATAAHLLAARYWARYLDAAPTPAAATMCGLWIAGHVLTEHRQAAMAEAWVLRAGQRHPHVPLPGGGLPTSAGTAQILMLLGPGWEQCPDVGVLLAMAPALPQPARYALLLLHAGQLWHRGRPVELERWLTSSTPTLALGAWARARPVVRALRIWAAWWTPREPWLDVLSAWDLLWSWAMVVSPRAPLVVEILLSALTAPRPRAEPGQSPPGGYLLAAHDRLATYAEAAVAAHPDAHPLHYHLAVGLREAGRHREAAAALRAAQRLLPAHPGAAWWRQSYTLRPSEGTQ